MPYIAVAIGVALAAIDQVIKFFVNANLKEVGSVSVIDNLLSFTYVENNGVAFGSFAGNRWIFVVLTTALIAAILIYMFKKKPQSKLFYASVALLVGGGIGNFIDRVLYGYVIDYISLSFFPPVCNFADYCITVGTVLLMIYVLFFTNTGKKDLKNDKA
ncbi:signal peptidase II [Ruminococcus sp.]|jgi:signal peptidase II|uniref:signal peptidase II n=1 Tax=Ruminococcus sp. TaxID=41978 RepID=UPI0035224CCA